jgi:phosphate:Na+ symporter
MNKYINSDNEYIKKEYNSIRRSLTDILRNIDLIIHSEEQVDKNILISKIDMHIEKNDLIANGKLDELIRNNKITSKMATSLMNDSSYTYNIAVNLKEMTKVLYVKDPLKLDEEVIDSDDNEINEEHKNETK